jgi:hypothetical protein
VVSDFPLADILHNRNATECISKWAMELGPSCSTSSTEQPSSRRH